MFGTESTSTIDRKRALLHGGIPQWVLIEEREEGKGEEDGVDFVLRGLLLSVEAGSDFWWELTKVGPFCIWNC